MENETMDASSGSAVAEALEAKVPAATDVIESTIKLKRQPAPKPNWKPGEIVSVPLKYLEIAEDKNDPLFDITALEEADANLTDDIKQDGFNSVIWAVEREAGTLTIIAGRRRFKAAEEARQKEVEVKIFDPKLDSFTLIRLMIVENERRHQDTSINKARKAQRLLNAYIERIRPEYKGIEQDENGDITYTGDAWTPSSKQIREGLEEVAKAFGFKSYKRVKDQLLPLVENLSSKVQKALEQGKIPEALALTWKDKTHEQQEKALERALEKSAGEKIKGKGSTRKAGEYPKFQFKRPQLEEVYDSEVAPKPVQEFLGFYLGHKDLEQAPRWIKKLMEVEAEEEEAEE